MSFRDALAGTVARDPRYSIEAYEFVIEALDFTKARLRSDKTKRGGKGRGHVSGRQLSEGARDLALRQFGPLALVVLERWGIRSTSDIGDIVYNMIAAGGMERSPRDSRSDFDGVYDFDAAFRRDYVLSLEDVD